MATEQRAATQEELETVGRGVLDALRGYSVAVRHAERIGTEGADDRQAAAARALIIAIAKRVREAKAETLERCAGELEAALALHRQVPRE